MTAPRKALVFAAGLGERMRPLTDHTPKPLLEAGGKPLIAWHLEKLAAIGVRDVVVNTSWLAGRFPDVLGDGRRWGLRLHFAHEGDTPLETGGGMLRALPLLGDAPFIAISGDTWTDFDFARLPDAPRGDAHLVLVDNPAHHPEGDFVLAPDERVSANAAGGAADADAHSNTGAAANADASPHASAGVAVGARRLTFGGIGVYRPSLLQDWRAAAADDPATRADADPPRFRLAPLLRAAMARGAVTGEHHRGRWTDVGTPERLHALSRELDA